jgi:hypothetical protein
VDRLLDRGCPATGEIDEAEGEEHAEADPPAQGPTSTS